MGQELSSRSFESVCVRQMDDIGPPPTHWRRWRLAAGSVPSFVCTQERRNVWWLANESVQLSPLYSLGDKVEVGLGRSPRHWWYRRQVRLGFLPDHHVSDGGDCQHMSLRGFVIAIPQIAPFPLEIVLCGHREMHVQSLREPQARMCTLDHELSDNRL